MKDTVKYLLSCAQREVCWNAGPINIASGQETSVLELFSLLSIVLNYKKEPKFLPQRIGDVLRHCGSTNLLLLLTGLPAPRKIDLEGLKETCQSYM